MKNFENFFMSSCRTIYWSSFSFLQ